MAYSLLFILSHSPRQYVLATEALDAVMTAVLLGTETDVVLVGEGLELLQDENTMDRLSQIATMGNCRLYTNDGENSVSNDTFASLQSGSLGLIKTDLSALLHQHQCILSF